MAKVIQKVAAINDLSGFGRCSLTVALPILSAMGYQVCPAPTTILSAHTGYESPYITDFTPHLQNYLQHWDRLDLSFDCIYTGFLGNEEQAAILRPFLEKQREKGRFVLVDPAMADHGCLYATCTPGLVEAMKQLVAQASVATPNLTEACLLTDTDYDALLALPDNRRREAVETIGRQLLTLGCEAAVITGVPAGEEWLENGVFTAVDKSPTFLRAHRIACNFAGTGDVFASVLCGWLLRGLKLEQAVKRTADFVSEATAYTADHHAPEQDGIAFEPFLSRLCEKNVVK